MTEPPDTTTMSGAEFQRHVGTDAEKWAEACYAAMRAPSVYGDSLDGPGRIAFLAQWFRDAMDAAAARAKWDVQGDCLKLIDNLVRHDD